MSDVFKGSFVSLITGDLVMDIPSEAKRRAVFPNPISMSMIERLLKQGAEITYTDADGSTQRITDSSHTICKKLEKLTLDGGKAVTLTVSIP